jgi:hypothetical protein
MKEPTRWSDLADGVSVTTEEGAHLLLENGGALLLENGGDALLEDTVLTEKEPVLWSKN